MHDHALTIGGLLASGLARRPHEEIVSGPHRFRLDHFADRVHRLAAALAALGIGPGDVVGVMDWDTHRYLECFFAIPMLGATLHTINIRLAPEQILYTINHAPDRAVLVHADFLPLFAQLVPHLVPGKILVLMADGPIADSGVGFDAEYEPMLAAAAPARLPDLPESTRATLFYTSGTTGLPKGVTFTHRQICLHTLALASLPTHQGAGGAGPEAVYMPLTPLFHVHAWGVPYLATARGQKQVYPGRFAPDRAAHLIAREGVTISHGVPTVLEMLLNAAEAQNLSMRGLKMIIGGAALPRAVALRALEAGIDVVAGYGMSETCPILTVSRLRPGMETLPPGQQADIRCRAGLPSAFVQVRIVDDEMNDVACDGAAQGEIVVRAPWLTQGYLHDEAATERLWRGGWLHTGDIGQILPDGYLRITDRLKDVIKTGGEWVSSIDLEDLIRQLPSVAEAGVIGIPDPVWTERPLAAVVPRPGHDLTADQVRAHLQHAAAAGFIAKYAVPDRIELVATLAKTSVGKIDKKALRAQFVQAAVQGT